MPQKPILLFDGDCGFCRRWIERWRFLTEGKVAAEPYQSRLQDFPSISKEQFEKSVFLVEDGRTTRAAEAVFRTLAYNPKHRAWLFLYEKIPAFRFLSEKFYSLVAARRVLFSQVTKFLWGSDLRPDTFFISRQIFFRGLALIYASAFASLAVQTSGLFGANGILPVKAFLAAVLNHFKNSLTAIWNVPSVFWLNAGDFQLQAVCAAGVIISFILLSGFAMRGCLFLLWLLYLSFVSIGQDFLSFQWDILLLETGFLALFWAPSQKGFLKPADWKSKPVDFSRSLLIFLLFKLMLSSGLVKIFSGDLTWRNLSALSFHYETQPLPNVLGWFAHQLPAWFGKISVFILFMIEIFLPFFLFFPRNLRRFSALALVFLQVLILLTGNYCFFNFLSLILCVAVLDDLFWNPKATGETTPRRPPFFWKIAAYPALLIFLLIGTNQIARILSLQLPWTGPAFSAERLLYPLHSVNNYGLFAIMTQKRIEISIEGSNDGNEWKIYEFKFKPGNPESAPPWAAPHQPRLDWQMWFAALSSPDRQPWFTNFCARLLQGSPEVLKLLSYNPFPEHPPRYIRASGYRYQFTTAEEKRLFKAWWKRDYQGLYLPPIALNAEDNSPVQPS